MAFQFCPGFDVVVRLHNEGKHVSDIIKQSGFWNVQCFIKLDRTDNQVRSQSTNRWDHL